MCLENDREKSDWYRRVQLYFNIFRMEWSDGSGGGGGGIFV